MAEINFDIVDHTEPTKAPHELVPAVKSLIDAGEGKAARVDFDTEEAARLFGRQLNTAAAELDKGIRVVSVEQEGKRWIGTYKVREKLTRRPRKPVEAEAATEQVKPVA